MKAASCGAKMRTVVCVMNALRDGSLFMGMTGSGKNRTDLEDFSFRGDELCVFFLNKEIRL